MDVLDASNVSRPLSLAAMYTVVVLFVVATIAYNALSDAPTQQLAMADSFGPVSVAAEESTVTFPQH